jgi:hypothetical protein
MHEEDFESNKQFPHAFLLSTSPLSSASLLLFAVAIKVLVVGNGGVGKSSLIRRFCKDSFTDQYKKTIGVDFLEKQQFIPSLNENVTLMLWDTAGKSLLCSLTVTHPSPPHAPLKKKQKQAKKNSMLSREPTTEVLGVVCWHFQPRTGLPLKVLKNGRPKWRRSVGKFLWC